MAALDGPALKIIRERSGWNAKPFAERVGISLSYLGDIEAGRRLAKRNPDLAKRMADALNVPTSMIERRVEPEGVSAS